MYQLATGSQMRDAHPHPVGRLLRWLLSIVVLIIAMGGFGVISALQSPGTVTCAPPACPIPPPRVHTLTAAQRYTSSTYGYSVEYSTARITPASTNASSIAWDAQLEDGSEIAWSFHGINAQGHGAQQIVGDVQSSNFADANRAFAIPGAEIGYTSGYGNVYDLQVSPGTGQSVHDRLIIMAAVKRGVAVIFVGVGPYKQTNQKDGHPNPADTPLVALGDVEQSLESVAWKGDPPL